jgi:hypothetical protein
MVVGEASK